jgi:lipopolysaccharide export system protein LptA
MYRASPSFNRPAPLFLALMLLAGVASAKTSDRNVPMDIKADRSDFIMKDESDSTLSGNVVITQGTLVVNADKAVIKRKKDDIDEVVLTGAPATLREVSDAGEPMTAHASQIDYTLSAQLVVLTGGAEVQQPRGNISGETITYDLKSGRLNGGGDGKRVSVRIMPKTAKPAGKDDKPAAPAGGDDKPASAASSGGK